MTVRQRQRDEFLGTFTESGRSWNINNPGQYIVFPTTYAPVMRKQEYILDHIKEGGRRVNHEASHHLRLEKFGIAKARRYQALSSGDMYESLRSTAGAAKAHYEMPAPVLPQSPDWNTAWAALMDDAWGAFPGESTLLVNIAEFTEIKGLFKGLASFLKGNKVKNLKAFLRRRWDDPITTLVNDHLAVKFGVMPLIKDSVLAFTGYEACKSRWDVLKQAQGLRKVRGYATYAPVNFQRTYASLTYPWKTVHVTQMQTCKAGITADCQFQLIPAAAVMTRLMLAKLGVLNPLVAGWNIIPFSFLVDRILPISKALDRISPYEMVTGSRLGSPVQSISLSNIVSFTKCETQVETRQHGKDPGPGKGELLSCDAWVLERDYARTIGAPIYHPYQCPQLRGFDIHDAGTFDYGNTVLEIMYQRLFKK